jgi:hypothetical protein
MTLVRTYNACPPNELRLRQRRPDEKREPFRLDATELECGSC